MARWSKVRPICYRPFRLAVPQIAGPSLRFHILLIEPDLRNWRVAAGIPFRVRPAALAEPDLVRYTIRPPAGVIHRGLAPSV